MRKKLSLKLICGILAIILLLQALPVAASAAEKNTQPAQQSNAEVQAASDVWDEIGYLLLRYTYFNILYAGSIMPADIQNATLKRLEVYPLGDNVYSMIGNFENKALFSKSEYSITVIAGERAFWKTVVDSPYFILSAALNMGNVLVNTIASTHSEYTSAARSIVSKSGIMIGDAYLLQKAYKGLANKDSTSSIALIPGFTIHQTTFGIKQEISRGDHCIICTADEGFTSYPLPENIVLPGWVEKGPVPVQMS